LGFLENDGVACKHNCRDKKSCRHLCCKTGIPQKRKLPPTEAEVEDPLSLELLRTKAKSIPSTPIKKLKMTYISSPTPNIQSSNPESIIEESQKQPIEEMNDDEILNFNPFELSNTNIQFTREQRPEIQSFNENKTINPTYDHDPITNTIIIKLYNSQIREYKKTSDKDAKPTNNKKNPSATLQEYKTKIKRSNVTATTDNNDNPPRNVLSKPLLPPILSTTEKITNISSEIVPEIIDVDQIDFSSVFDDLY